MKDDSGITESHTRGWGYTLLTIVGVSSVVFIGAWALLTVALKSIDTAAVIMIITLFAFLTLIGLPGLGMYAANVIQKNTIENVRAKEQAQQLPVIESTARALPPPATWLVSGNTMQLEQRVEQAATKVYMALKPQNIPPTRENIRKVTGESSHEFGAAVVNWLAERGYVDAKGQGQAPMWRE